MRVSSCLVAHRGGKFLMQLRTDDAPTWAGCWGLFGGGWEPGEGATGALLREVDEELALDVSGAAPLCVLADEKIIIHYFVMGLPDSEDEASLSARQTEGAGLGFFTVSEVAAMASLGAVVDLDAVAVAEAARSLGL